MSVIEIPHHNAVCTETYLIAGAYNEKKRKQKTFNNIYKPNLSAFLSPKLQFSTHITKGCFAFVPLQDFSRPWTDADLYAKYNLTEEEIAFIESMIRPMDLDGGDSNA